MASSSSTTTSFLLKGTAHRNASASTLTRRGSPLTLHGSMQPRSTPRRPPFRRHKDVLANGLKVITVELTHLHSASVVMYARVGSRYETARDNGLSHFLEHMLFRGTERLPDAYRLNHAIEALGGTLYAETGRDYSLYQISLHPETLDGGIALFGEIFCTPTFSDIEVERRIILEEMLEDLD